VLCPRRDGYGQCEIASIRVKSQLFLSFSPSAILIPSPLDEGPSPLFLPL
jgi:hypothetical protein